LLELLREEDDISRLAAIWTLGRIGPPAKAALEPLRKLREDSDVQLSMEVADAVRRIEKQPPAAVPILVRSLQEDDERIRATAGRILSDIGADAREAVPQLRANLKDDDVDARTSAARALWRIERQSKETAPVLLAAWKQRACTRIRTSNRLLLVEALGEMGEQDKSVLPVLVEMARFETYRVSQAAAKIVKQLDPKAAAEAGIR
jgi:HEAT repeat protein